MSPLLRLDSFEPFQAINLLLDPGAIPGPVVIPNCARVRLNWNLTGGTVAHNVLYAQYDGDPGLSPAVAEAIRSSITAPGNWTTLAGFIAPTASLAGVTVLDVRDATSTEFNSTGSAVPGTSTGTALPDEVAAVVTLRTGNRGPAGRGRMYLPGFATNAGGTGGVIAAACVTAITAWASTQLANAIATNVGTLSLGLRARAAYTSPITGRVFPARPAAAVPVTSIVCRDNHWDSQRRRGLK